MSDLPPSSPAPPPDGPVSHRGEFETTPFLARLLAPVTAVAVVIVVVILLIIINGHGSGGSSTAAVTHGTPPPSPTHAAPSSPAPSPHPTKTHPSPSPSKSTTSPAPTASTAAPKAPTATAPVQVLDNSRRIGLAHEVAAIVGDRGWQIASVGNLQGLVPVTTVYYPPGDRAAARHLESEFSSIARIEPNSEGRITNNNLTLVVTRDWVL